MRMKKTTYEDMIKTLDEGMSFIRRYLHGNNQGQYIIVMFFLKFLSDSFEEDVWNLKKKYEGIRLERQIANLPISLEPESTFSYLKEHKMDSNIGVLINDALEGIERSDKLLEGLFTQIDFNREENFGEQKQKNEFLFTLITMFEKLNLCPGSIETKEGEEPSFIIGDAINYITQKYDMNGRRIGSYSANKLIAHLMVQLNDIQKGESIYDPVCGSGMYLAEAVKNNIDGENPVYGQDIDATSVMTARINMFLYQIKNAHIAWGDTIANPLFLEDMDELKKFDCIFAKIPSGVYDWEKGFCQNNLWSEGSIGLESGRSIKTKRFKMDPSFDHFHRFDIGIPPANRGEWAFLLHILHSLSEKGRAVSIVNPLALARAHVEETIRRNVIENNMLDAVISLPGGMIGRMSIPYCLLIFRKQKTRLDTLFIDAESLLNMNMKSSKIDGAQNTENDFIRKIVDTYKKYTKGENPNEIRFSRVVSREEIQSKDYVLTVSRYINNLEEEKTDLNQLREEIEEIQNKINLTEQDIQENLKKLKL